MWLRGLEPEQLRSGRSCRRSSFVFSLNAAESDAGGSPQWLDSPEWRPGSRERWWAAGTAGWWRAASRWRAGAAHTHTHTHSSFTAVIQLKRRQRRKAADKKSRVTELGWIFFRKLNVGVYLFTERIDPSLIRLFSPISSNSWTFVRMLRSNCEKKKSWLVVL